MFFSTNLHGFKDIEGWRSYPMNIDSVAMLHITELNARPPVLASRRNQDFIF